jgi:hypothetical protein
MNAKPSNCKEAKDVREAGFVNTNGALPPGAGSRLFRVRAVFDTVIIATSEEDARNQVKHGMDEIEDSPIRISTREIKRREDLPTGWDGKCLPWGKQPLGMDRNIDDFLAENAPVVAAAPPTQP